MNYPNWIENESNPARRAAWKRMWSKPWTVPASSSKRGKFKDALWGHGYLSPHFTRDEAGSHDGQPVPSSLRHQAQYHAFRLEIVRHKLDDKSMAANSWYRSPQHNAAVGGVSNSQHLQAWATDWSDAMRAKLGYQHFDQAMKEVFGGGGIGTVYGSSQVRHVDNGPQRRWTYGS